MAQVTKPAPLPPGLDLLWGRRERGQARPAARGCRRTRSSTAAIRLADAEGLEAVSMARVAAELGFTTMSLYRYVASKDELLQLMWNASALGAEDLVLEGDGWRAAAADVGDHPAGHARPAPVDHPDADGRAAARAELAALRRARARDAWTGPALADADKLRVIGLISSYTLSEARMANDAAARRAGRRRPRTRRRRARCRPGRYEALLRELVDEQTYPRLYRIAWTPERPARPPSEREEFLFGVDLILDGVQALIDRAKLRAEGAVEVAQQGDLGAVVQDLLVDPPDDVDEHLPGVAAVRVGAVADGVQRGVVAAAAACRAMTRRPRRGRRPRRPRRRCTT